MKLLIITRDPETAELLKLSFELEGFNVAHALSATVARDMVGQQKPDVCIIDVMGSRGEEYEAVEAAIVACDTQETIVMTLLPTVKNAANFPAIHAHHVTKKPYNLSTLVATITSLIAAREE